MGWRKILKDDIKRGTIIRMTGMMNDGSYHMATIIAVELKGSDSNWSYVRVSRPFAYAHEHFDSRSPLLGAETFEIGMDKILSPDSDIEVFQGRDGNRTMAT